MTDLIEAIEAEARRRQSEARFLPRGRRQDRERHLAELLEQAAAQLVAGVVVRQLPVGRRPVAQ